MAKFTAKAGEQDLRADVFIASKYPQFSRSALGQLFDKQMITIASKPIKASHKIQPDDKVEVDETYFNTEPPEVDLPIIFEDDAVIVIDKPAGLLTHSKGALNLEATVASFVSNKITDKALSGNRAGIVHRLDRGTSGVIIAAKTKAAQDWLQKQFAKRNAKKTYLAVVHGTPKPAEAIINAPIARNPAKPQLFRVDKTGKNAITQYKVLKTKGKYSQVVLKPLTGRTHQLRVHLSYIGHPIVGDSFYGKDSGQTILHAKSLELTLPNGERRKFISETPGIFSEIFNE